jgi:hypothetical protein
MSIAGISLTLREEAVRENATKTQKHKVLIFRFYFFRAFVALWQNITLEMQHFFHLYLPTFHHNIQT